MSGRSAYSRKRMEKQTQKEAPETMSTESHIGRSLSESGSWRASHSRSRSLTDQDIALSRDEAKSRAKVAGILGFEDAAPRLQTRNPSTSRNRGLPLRTHTRGSDRRAKSPISDDISPCSGHVSNASPFSRATAQFSAINFSTTNFHLAWSDTWVWYGGGRTPQRYRGFTEDRDMYMSNGDTAVYFTEEAGVDDARPHLRVHSSVLQQSHSVLLSNLLKYGALYSEHDVKQPMLTPPQSEINSPGAEDAKKGKYGYFDDDDSIDGEYSTLDSTKSFFLPSPRLRESIPNFPTVPNTKLPKQLTGKRNFSGVPTRERGLSIDTDLSDDHSSGPAQQEDADINHELWLSPPSHITEKLLQRRHHLGTRNFFALLYGHPLVGTDFYEMLVDLQTVMEDYFEHNSEEEKRNIPKVIIGYLKERKLDDLRGNRQAALGLLAWCEEDSVQWEEGYLEAFTHSVGMMSQTIMETAQFQRLSRVTRYNLENAYNDLRLRVLIAEEKLATFDFSEMWETRGAHQSPAYRSYQAFREFILSFYGHVFANWPPLPTSAGTWLTRDIVRRLQQDFGAVYDYMVDMDVLWDASEERSTRKWEMMKRVPTAERFNADKNDIPVTDILVSFDSRHQFHHIPFPFPLAPRPHVNSTMGNANQRKTIFSSLRRTKTSTTIKDPKEQIQMALAYNGATNISRFGSAFPSNELIDRLEQYEKTHAIPNANAYESRIGRWILIYGILQVLSTLSVDNSGLSHPDTCQYFLCASLSGCPPWRDSENDPNGTVTEACQTKSYCWTAPQRWDEIRRRTQPQNSKENLSNPMSAPPCQAPQLPVITPAAHAHELMGSLGQATPSFSLNNSSTPNLRNLTSPTGFVAELDGASTQVVPQLPPYTAEDHGSSMNFDKKGVDLMKPVPPVPALGSPRRLDYSPPSSSRQVGAELEGSNVGDQKHPDGPTGGYGRDDAF